MRILIVEDERALCDTLVKSLKQKGYEVDACYDGDSALDWLLTEKYDLLLLDLNLPGRDGMDLLKTLREQDRETRVLILSARSRISDKVEGLDCGANDYLVKPFSFEELMARLRAMTRSPFGMADNTLAVADLTMDCAAHTVRRGGREIALSAKEYALLEYLLRNRGIVLSREKIENHIWNFEYEGGTNVVDVYIRYLRKKIDDGFEPKLIHTVRGSGYVLREGV